MPEGALRTLADADLYEALSTLGSVLDLPADPHVAFAAAVRALVETEAGVPSGAGVRPLPARSTRRRRFAGAMDRVRWLPPARRVLVLVAALLILGALAAGAAALGVRGIRIIFGPPPSPPASFEPTGSPGPSPAPLGADLYSGTPVTLVQAQARVAFHILVPTEPGLAAPEVFLDTSIPGGQVTLAYPAGGDLPSIGSSGVGIVVREFAGRVERPFLEKFIEPGTTVEPVQVGGFPGFWISGAPHEIGYVGPDGGVRFNTLHLSGNALIWEQGGLTLRLETVSGESTAVRIGASAR